jgi:hypothetical protein
MPPVMKRSAATVRGFAYPNKGHVRHFVSGTRRILPTAKPTIDETVTRVKMHDAAKKRSSADQAAALSAALHAKRIADHDLPDPGKVTIEEDRKGQKYWEFE